VSRGIERERQVRRHLEAEGWWTMRAAASKGAVDIVALKATHAPRFIQVKSDKAGPFDHFGPQARAELLTEAGQAGAVAELAHWPPRGELRFIPPADWP
jgi:Holliday junction resolvase